MFWIGCGRKVLRRRLQDKSPRLRAGASINRDHARRHDADRRAALPSSNDADRAGAAAVHRLPFPFHPAAVLGEVPFAHMRPLQKATTPRNRRSEVAAFSLTFRLEKLLRYVWA